jgi:urease accessory protein
MLVCDTYHGNVDTTEPDADDVETVVLTRDGVRRGRVRTTTERGREVGVVLDRRLRDGDIVHDGETAIVVELEEIEAFAVCLDGVSPSVAAPLGHELGNAHHEMAVENGIAYVPANDETRKVLESETEGYETTEVEPSVFDSFGEKKPKDHRHEHSSHHV